MGNSGAHPQCNAQSDIAHDCSNSYAYPNPDGQAQRNGHGVEAAFLLVVFEANMTPAFREYPFDPCMALSRAFSLYHNELDHNPRNDDEHKDQELVHAKEGVDCLVNVIF